MSRFKELNDFPLYSIWLLGSIHNEVFIYTTVGQNENDLERGSAKRRLFTPLKYPALKVLGTCFNLPLQSLPVIFWAPSPGKSRTRELNSLKLTAEMRSWEEGEGTEETGNFSKNRHNWRWFDLYKQQNSKWTREVGHIFRCRYLWQILSRNIF